MIEAWLISLLGASAAVHSPHDYPLACAYSSAEGLENADHCAVRAGSGFSLAPAVLDDLSYASGLASLAIGKSWYLRRRDGRMVEMLMVDNGPDAFSQGLARGRVGGRLVYVDRRLQVRIRTRYTYGEPFQNGRAAVCIGCVEAPADAGEHKVMTGGRWGVIDRRGREVVPTTLTQDAFVRLRSSARRSR